MEYPSDLTASYGRDVKMPNPSNFAGRSSSLMNICTHEIKSDIGFGVVYEWNIVNDRIEWYGEIYKKLGYSHDGFPSTQKAWGKIIHPGDYKAVHDRIHKHLKTEELYLLEYRVQRKEGTFIYVLDYGTTLRNKYGTPYKWVGFMKLLENRIYLS